MPNRKRFIVNVREVHIQPVLVEAFSAEEAAELVDSAHADYCDLSLEYSHMMGKEFWTTEELERVNGG